MHDGPVLEKFRGDNFLGVVAHKITTIGREGRVVCDLLNVRRCVFTPSHCLQIVVGTWLDLSFLGEGLATFDRESDTIGMPVRADEPGGCACEG